MNLISTNIPALIDAIKKATFNPNTSELATESQAAIDSLLTKVISDNLIAKAATTHADDASAAAAGVPIGGYYVVTSTGVVHARLV